MSRPRACTSRDRGGATIEERYFEEYELGAERRTLGRGHWSIENRRH
jgi:hypothetical protein